MCPRKVIGSVLIALCAGILLTVLLPAWIIVWVLVIVLVLLGLSQMK